MKNNRIDEEDLRNGITEKARLAKEAEASHHAEEYASRLPDDIRSHENPYEGSNERLVCQAHEHLHTKGLITHVFKPVTDRPSGQCFECNSSHVALMRAYILGRTVV